MLEHRMVLVALCGAAWMLNLELAPASEPAPPWVAPMRKVHARFKGVSGSCAHFGDSLTATLAYWAPLPHSRKNASPEFQHAYEVASARLAIECWRDWKGPRFGNRSGAGVLWAQDNIDRWLKTLNPEVAVILFGTNDVGKLDANAYRESLALVLQKCLDNGTVPILTTIPPRRDADRQVAEFADVSRDLARRLQIPLIDLHAEILRRRPDDWDGGKLPRPSGGAPRDGHDVLTLIAADGVHLSHPDPYRNDYSAESLRCNGYALRTALTLLAYADVVERVFEDRTSVAAPAVSPEAEPATRPAPATPAVAPAVGNRSPARSVDRRWGTHFASPDGSFERAPRLAELTLPASDATSSVCDAVGRDDVGNIYLGLSTGSPPTRTRLLKLPPGTSLFVPVGDRGSLTMPGNGDRDRQSLQTIPGRICQAADGAVYFASTVETRLPDGGVDSVRRVGHLWRIRPGETQYEHLFDTPVALTALETTGRFVYALGAPDHVLYQFDTATGGWRSVVVGAAHGHASRHFLVDLREHVFVPRVESVAHVTSGDRSVSFVGQASVRSWLVEYDTDLQERHKSPLTDYHPGAAAFPQGILSFAALRSGQLVFTTHSGAFWCVTPATNGPGLLERLGWFHPESRSSAVALFCPTGRRYVGGLAAGKNGFEWVLHDLESWTSAVRPLDADSRTLLQRNGLMISGTNTLDDRSRGYLVGRSDASPGGFVLRMDWSP